MTPDISLISVLVAAIAQLVIGSIWFGPLLGKTWAALAGVKPEAMKPQPAALAAMIASALVMAYVLAHILVFASAYTKAAGIPAGLAAGFWCWLGFAAPITLGPVIYEGKPIRLWLITGGYYLVSLLAMGAILALWR